MGIERAGMTVSVTDCMVSEFMSGSVRAEMKLNVSQPAFLMNSTRRLNTDSLKLWFNTSAAQMAAARMSGHNLTVSLEAADVFGELSIPA